MISRETIDARLGLVARLHSILGILGILVSVLLGAGSIFVHLKSTDPHDVRIVLDIISFAGVFASMGLSIGLVAVGRAVRRRVRHPLCVVVSALLCPAVPFGTAVGVYSLYVLLSQEGRAAFGETNVPLMR